MKAQALGIAIVAVVVIVVVIGLVRQMAGRLMWRVVWGLIKVVVRFITGAPLDGRHTTDATFFSAGTEQVDRKGHYFGLKRATWWSMLPGYKRAVARFVAIAAAGAAWQWRTQAAVTLVVVLGVFLGVLVWRAIDGAMHWNHRRRYVYPLHEVLAHRVGHGVDVRPEEWLHIPTDFTDQSAVIELEMPSSYDSDQTPDVVKKVTDKLGISPADLDVSAQMVGSAPSVRFVWAPRPPKQVLFCEVREILEKLAKDPKMESKPIAGLARHSEPHSVDLDAEAPHTLLSMAPGRGKSMFAMSQAAQVLHNGGQAVFLDVKWASHAWARHADGAAVLCDIRDIHNGLVAMGAEGERRNRLAGFDKTVQFTRLFVVCEEMNVLTNRLRAYWRKIQPKKGMPSPAIEALEALLFMGRHVKINVMAIAQYATARTIGGPEGRETFANRILGGWTNNGWKMLVPEVPMPRKSKHRGRVQVVVDGHAEEVQGIKWTEEEAIEWANSGIPSQRPNFAQWILDAAEALGQSHEELYGTDMAALLAEMTPTVEQTPVTADQADEIVLAELVDQPEPTPAGPALVTLREAHEKGIVNVHPELKNALEIMRSARKRDDRFPAAADKRGQDLLYNPLDLQIWERNRERSGQKVPDTEDAE
ncbi:hypothetical protein ACI2LF_43755 [Kribbella sp. NPDC020789]